MSERDRRKVGMDGGRGEKVAVERDFRINQIALQFPGGCGHRRSLSNPQSVEVARTS